MHKRKAVVTINPETIKALFLVQKNILTQLMTFDSNALDRVQVNLIVKEAIKRTEEQLDGDNGYRSPTL